MKEVLQALSNKLLGRTIRPAQSLLDNPDMLARLWKLKPNLSGQYFATIEAAWLSSDNKVKVMAFGPMGDIAELLMLEGLIEYKPE